MKKPTNSLPALARVILLLAACLSTSEGVQVAVPAQADLQVHEDLGVDGGSAFDAPNVNALYDTTGLKNEIVALRFDLTGKNRLQSTNAWLKLTNSKQNTTNQVLNFYGVTDGAMGVNEINPVAGTFTDDDWPESGTVFSTTPALRYDANSVTTGVDTNLTTFLGSVTVDNGNRAEGAETILSTPELQDFLMNHPDEVVTILVSSLTNGTSQKRFATKDATTLDTILTPVPAGTYAPRLVLDLPGETVKASADATVNEINGTATGPTYNTGNGTGLNLNARYTTTFNGERNEIIALRFDLTNVAAGQITAADLRLINHRTNTNFNRLRFYGVNNGAKGFNAITAEDGPYTDNDWQDNSPGLVFSAIPGLEMDQLITTLGVRTDRVTDLGSTYVSGGNRNSAEGVQLIFATPQLLDFLNNHPDRIVTILVMTDEISNGQKRFASKETLLLDGEVEDPENPIPPGFFTPALSLQVVPADTFAITNFTLGSGTSQITLTWESEPAQIFRITYSENLQDGFPGVAASNIPAAVGTTTSHTFANPVPAAQRLFFRVERP